MSRYGGLPRVLAEQVGFVSEFAPPGVESVDISGIVIDVYCATDGVEGSLVFDQVADRLPHGRFEKPRVSSGSLGQQHLAIQPVQMDGALDPRRGDAFGGVAFGGG